uniref:transmembrane protein 26 n=1 Tax=Doryrhamphus excisus TaxID=161450 RepID=UPI0025AE06C6|nr:transmembrane protein 26 [Doryrhamphus excisus]
MCRLLDIILALLSRILFAVHGAVTVWRVVLVKGDMYWLLLSGVGLLGIEMVITLRCTDHGEWKWFSPMVFLYLCTVVPSIWLLELNLVQTPTNETLQITSIPIDLPDIPLEPESWVAGLEQTMLIVLVLGRWMMPMGHMSRDQLSQLLMVYVGLGADILDIFDTFTEPNVKNNIKVIYMGLALFTWALLQFPLVLTQKSSHHRRSKGRFVCWQGKNCLTSCCPSEVWSLLVTVGFQDGPFLAYRLYLMVMENVLNQLMIYFTCKNILIVLIEFYRMFVVKCDQWNEQSADAQSETALSLRRPSMEGQAGAQEGQTQEEQEAPVVQEA